LFELVRSDLKEGEDPWEGTATVTLHFRVQSRFWEAVVVMGDRKPLDPGPEISPTTSQVIPVELPGPISILGEQTPPPESRLLSSRLPWVVVRFEVSIA
jgi:hypothetical protein